MNNEISIESIVSHRDGEGKVHLKWGKQEGQLTVPEARQHALRILACAEAAESEALVFTLAKELTNGDQRMSGIMLTQYRKLRRDLDDLRALNDERNKDDA